MEEKNINHRRDWRFPASIVFSVVVIAGTWVYTTGLKTSSSPSTGKVFSGGTVEHGGDVVVTQSAEIPITWGDLGARMIESGVIQKEQFERVYAARGGLSEEDKKLLTFYPKKSITVTQENAGVLLNLLWAMGLGNKSPVLERGPMMDPRYGGAGRFASTGGWTLAKGNPMDHYSKHSFMILTPEAQQLVERVSRGIYRPCCDNSTYFPDCNHGMAMLGLLELLAAQGATEATMYRAALTMNSFWFPEQYATIEKYLVGEGQDPRRADPHVLLGAEYSSITGFQSVAARIPREENQGSGGCGV